MPNRRQLKSQQPRSDIQTRIFKWAALVSYIAMILRMLENDPNIHYYIKSLVTLLGK